MITRFAADEFIATVAYFIVKWRLMSLQSFQARTSVTVGFVATVSHCATVCIDYAAGTFSCERFEPRFDERVGFGLRVRLAIWRTRQVQVDELPWSTGSPRRGEHHHAYKPDQIM